MIEGLKIKKIIYEFKKQISIKMCRAQGYGAAVMSGAYNGLQSKIVELKNTQYVHCDAHNLNLVINDVVSGVPEAEVFFDIVGCIYRVSAN